MGILEAAVANREEEVERLLNSKASVNETGYGGQTALAFAARHNNLQMVRCLLQAHAAVNTVDLVKATPLHEAAAGGYVSVVTALLDANADFRAKGFQGLTPLDAARESNQAETASLLERAFAGGRWDSQLTPQVPPLQLELAGPVSVDNPVAKLARHGDLRGLKDALDVGFDPDGAPEVRTDESDSLNPGRRSLTYREMKRAAKEEQRGLHTVRPEKKPDSALSEWEAAIAVGLERSPLAWAARGGHEGIVECLLDARACVNGLVPRSVDSVAVVRSAISTGVVSPRSVQHGGAWTPVGLAAREGSARCLKLLLWARAEYTAKVPRSKEGSRTPIEWAARAGHVDCVNVWMEWLHQQDCPAEVVRDQASALLPHACYGGSAQAVELLLNAGALLKQSGTQQGTLLHIAAFHGHRDVCHVLLRSGGLLEAVEAAGDTPLCLASRQGHSKTFQLLVAAKANLWHQNTAGRTAFTLAAAADHLGVLVATLELAGGEREARVALLQHKDTKGLTVLATAAKGGSQACLERLLKEDLPELLDQGDLNGSQPLFLSAAAGHLGCSDCLIKAKANINAVNDNGNSALAAAVRMGHHAVATRLLEAKAALDKATQSPGQLLLFSAQSGRADITALLLDHSASVNAVSETGVTALATAAFHGQSEVASLLMERSADVNQADRNGWSPLALAAAHDHQSIVAELVNRGASFSAMSDDPHAKDAKYMAESNGHTQMVSLLKRLEVLGATREEVPNAVVFPSTSRSG